MLGALMEKLLYKPPSPLRSELDGFKPSTWSGRSTPPCDARVEVGRKMYFFTNTVSKSFTIQESFKGLSQSTDKHKTPNCSGDGLLWLASGFFPLKGRVGARCELALLRILLFTTHGARAFN